MFPPAPEGPQRTREPPRARAPGVGGGGATPRAGEPGVGHVTQSGRAPLSGRWCQGTPPSTLSRCLGGSVGIKGSEKEGKTFFLSGGSDGTAEFTQGPAKYF